jgi:hypothetical protein
MVNQFKNDKFPVEIRMSWNRNWKKPFVIPAILSKK